MNTIRVTVEYGLVIRQNALREKRISETKVFKIFGVTEPLDSNSELMSFGPVFGGEALKNICGELNLIGLSYFDDYVDLIADYPSWLQIRVCYDAPQAVV